MLLSLQNVVRSRFHTIVMAMIAGGFLMLLAELLIYAHYQQLQLIGFGAVVIGLICSVVGIGANARLRRTLAVIFLVLSITGVIGLYFHNEERLGGEEGGPPAQGEGGGEEGGEEGGLGEPRMEPPALASLSVSGLCIFGAVMLLARRDDE